MSKILGPMLALVLVPALFAQNDVQRGKVKKIDLDKKQVTLTVADKDVTFAVNEKTRVFGAEKKEFAERFGDLKPGTEVVFRADKDVLVAIRSADDRPPKVDLTKLKPLDELSTDKYHGYQGGFYPGGKNERPAAHEKAGLALAKSVKPLDSAGKPADEGKIVLLSVGMSNTAQSSQGFAQQLKGAKGINPRLQFVNGAQGGMTAEAIRDPDDKARGTKYWDTVDRMLKDANVTRAQVQVVWIKQADAGPSQGFPRYAQKLRDELADIVRLLPKRFPNVKLVYLSSRTYGGFARTRLNPEPYAFESGFSVKWLIEKQIDGDKELNFDPDKGAVKAPWLSWGPYLWANGTTRRKDGFSYDESDFTANDGTHQSPAGMKKVGKLLLDFFQSDSTTKPWFVR